MKKIALSEIQKNLSKYLQLAGEEEIMIIHDGKSAGILIGFQSEDDWLDYCLQNNPRFLYKIKSARKSLQSGQGVKLEDIEF